MTGIAQMASQIFVWITGNSVNISISPFLLKECPFPHILIHSITDYKEEINANQRTYRTRLQVLDAETRCAHYHTEIDRIAIKFYCCDTIIPCYECHEETVVETEPSGQKKNSTKKAILCGACGHELTVEEYLDCKSECP